MASSAEESPSQSAPASARPAARHLAPTPSHSCFTLIGASFLIFEFFFLSFYGNDFWFSLDVSLFGIPVVLTAMVVAHLLLTWQETSWGCVFFSELKNGSPVLVYRKWVTLDESGFSFGIRHLLFESIDEINLTFFGNLQIMSRKLCGPAQRNPDLVLKIPFACASLESQTEFVQALKLRQPHLVTNKRLDKRLASTELKAAQWVQLLGVVFMLLVLVDCGQAAFRFLQMMKDYYLAQTDARDGHMDLARKHFNDADQIRTHPFPLSWVDGKLLKQGTVASGVYHARAEAAASMGNLDQAIESARKAVELNPKGYRLNLYLARLLIEAGQNRPAVAQLQTAIKNHSDNLLPRLYAVSLLVAQNKPADALRLYDIHMDELKDEVYGDEPWWPPGGNRFLSEMFFQDDARFIFDRLLHRKQADKKSP